MMHTENTIIIKGPRERIFALAADVLRWPEILPHYRWVRLIGEDGDTRVVEMAAHRDGIPVKWTSVQERLPGEGRIIFRHIKGPTKGMYVEWTLRELGPGLVRVDIKHEFSPRWPLVGRFLAQRVVGDFFVKNIAGKTLGHIKRLVEHGQECPFPPYER